MAPKLLKETLQKEGMRHEKESWEPTMRKDRGRGRDGKQEGQRAGEYGEEEGQSMVQVRSTLSSVFLLLFCFFPLKKNIKSGAFINVY